MYVCMITAFVGDNKLILILSYLNPLQSFGVQTSWSVECWVCIGHRGRRPASTLLVLLLLIIIIISEEVKMRLLISCNMQWHDRNLTRGFWCLYSWPLSLVLDRVKSTILHLLIYVLLNVLISVSDQAQYVLDSFPEILERCFRIVDEEVSYPKRCYYFSRNSVARCNLFIFAVSILTTTWNTTKCCQTSNMDSVRTGPVKLS